MDRDASRHPAALRVLLVEDNRADARLIQLMLNEAHRLGAGTQNFDLVHATSLAQALERLAEVSCDVVLLDLTLPDSRGLETVAQMCAAAPDVPLLVLTGMDDEALGMQAVQQGAQDYLVKGQIDRPLLVRAMRHALERHRLRTQMQEEARLAGALAAVGRELISSLDTPVLLQRLCRMTTEALRCDFSQTWLWQAGEEAYAAVAAHGFTPEESESLRLIRLPRALIEPLREQDSVQMTTAGHESRIIRGMALQFGVTMALSTALRRGGELIGVQTSGYRGRTEPFTPQQVRVGCGVAQLASMALENARLFGELDRANRIKSNFVATMSHELRSPLNTIMGYGELLLDGSLGDLTSDQTKAMETIYRSAGELRDIMTATLDLSRFEARPVALEVQSVHLPDMLAEIVREMRGQFNKPGVRLQCKVPADLPAILTDAVKLKMVLKNLVGNALKFTERGTVTLHAEARAGGVELRCRDTGIGISPEAQVVIFDPFRQADRSVSNRYGGAGLGLYIVRRLLDMLGGTVVLESEVGRGSTFRVWLPYALHQSAE